MRFLKLTVYFFFFFFFFFFFSVCKASKLVNDADVELPRKASPNSILFIYFSFNLLIYSISNCKAIG
jgi:hypothetical protein